MTATPILTLLAVLATHAALAGAETSLVSLSRLRLHHLARSGARARALERLMLPPHHLLGAVQLGLTVVRLAWVWLVVWVSLPWRADLRWMAIALLAATLAFCGDALPRTWCRLCPIDRLLRFGAPLVWLERLLGPAVRWLRRLRLWVPESGTELESGAPRVTRETLDRWMRDSVETGAISPTERAMISRVFGLQRRPVREIMVPVERIVSVSSEATLAEFYALSRELGFIRMPVRNPAEVTYVGVINVYYVVGQTTDNTRKVGDFMRAPLFVPADMPIVDVLPRLRRSRQPLGLVRNGTSGVVGLVTVDDVLAAVIGGSA